MAKIIIEPNEVFEHVHNHDSYSTLLQGEALFFIDGVENRMQIDIPVLTPKNKSHVLHNIGLTPCIIRCGSHSTPD